MKSRKYFLCIITTLIIAGIMILINTFKFKVKADSPNMILNYDRKASSDNINNSNAVRVPSIENKNGDGIILLPTPDGNRTIIIDAL